MVSQKNKIVYKQMIAKHMGFVFLSGWVPIPGSSAGMEFYAEKELCDFARDNFLPAMQQDEKTFVMRFFKKKRFMLRTLELIPYAGSVLSIVHIYGKGHFLMELASRNVDVASVETRKEALQEVWTDFEHLLWDGESMIDFYEEISSQNLPPQIKEHFSKVLQSLEKHYQEKLSSNPKFNDFQEKGEEFVHNTVETAKSTAKNLFNKWFS